MRRKPARARDSSGNACEKCTGENSANLQESGFRPSFNDAIKNRQKYQVEATMLKYSFFVLALLAAIELAAHLLFSHAGLERYAWWIFYSNIAVVSLGAAMWHLKSYRTSTPLMPGMMIGMTFGMQTGLMTGTIIGATNGIFAGGMTGMAFGILAGVYNGRCCGIMGIMEGMMAGLMGGIMGGMTGAMFFADRILWFMPFFIAVNLAIMWGLSYMIYREIAESSPEIMKQPVSFAVFAPLCIAAVALLIAIMLYVPKSGLARAIA